MTDIEWKDATLNDLSTEGTQYNPLHMNTKVVFKTHEQAATTAQIFLNTVLGGDYDVRIVPATGLSVDKEGRVIVPIHKDAYFKIQYRPVPILERGNLIYLKSRDVIKKFVILNISLDVWLLHIAPTDLEGTKDD